ncbi:MAG: tetratricopeptide repeat protein [Planctomycetota bacterium]|jgi:tetratricopeptide (TPR) repeat protein
MSSLSYPSSRAICLAVLLVSLAGCQTVDRAATKLGLRKPTRRHAFAEMSELPPGEIDAKQKADVQMAVGRSLERQGALDQAINVYREVLRNDDSRADAARRLAVLYDLKGEFENSEEFYRAALSLEPNNAELFCDWGYRCYLRRDFQQAEINLRKAVSLNDGLARAHNNLGLLLGRTGRYDEALREFAKAGCSEADARSNLALALSLEGNTEAALEQYELALQRGPQSNTAREGLVALRAASSGAHSARIASVPTAPQQYGPPPHQSSWPTPPVQQAWAPGGPQQFPAASMQHLPHDPAVAMPPPTYPVTTGMH